MLAAVIKPVSLLVCKKENIVATREVTAERLSELDRNYRTAMLLSSALLRDTIIEQHPHIVAALTEKKGK